jgi:hypothetical protein
VERATRRSSSVPDMRPTGSGRTGSESKPREMLTDSV